MENLRALADGVSNYSTLDPDAAAKRLGIDVKKGVDPSVGVSSLAFRLVDQNSQNKPFVKFGIRLDTGEYFVQPEAVAKAMGPDAIRNELRQNVAALSNRDPSDTQLPVIKGALENIEAQGGPEFEPAGGPVPSYRKCIPGYGTEMLSNGNFTGSANGWQVKVGSTFSAVPAYPAEVGGWTYRSNRVEHAAGTDGTFEQAVSGGTSSSYRLYLKVRNWRSGSINISANGQTVLTVSGNGDYEKIFYSGVSRIVVTPTTDFAGYLDGFSVKPLATSSTGTNIDPPCYPSTDTVAYPLWEDTKQSDYNPGSADWGTFTKNMKEALTNPPYSFPLNIQSDASSYIWFKSMPPRRGNSSGAVNGTFTGNATGWTVGSGWEYSGNRMRHIPGAASTLEQPIPGTALGRQFRVFITVSGRTAGSVSVSIGGMASLPISADGRSIQRTFTAFSSANLKIVADAAFNGYIDDISVDDAPNPLFQPYSLIVAQWRNGLAQDYLGNAVVWGGPINLDCPEDGSFCANRMPDIATLGDCGETDLTAAGLDKKRACLARVLKFRDHAAYWKAQCSLDNAPAICTDRALNNMNANFMNTYRNLARTANTLAWLITDQTKANEILPTCGNVDLDHRCVDPGEITSLNTLSAVSHAITSRKRYGDMPHITEDALERDGRGVPKYLFTGKFTGVNDDTVSYEQSLYPYLSPVLRTYTFQPRTWVDNGVTLSDQKLYMTQSNTDSSSEFMVYQPTTEPKCAKAGYLENFTIIANRCNPHQGYRAWTENGSGKTEDSFYNASGVFSTEDPDRPFTRVTQGNRLFRIQQWKRPPNQYAPYSTMNFAPFGLISNGDMATNPAANWAYGADWSYDAAGTKLRHLSSASVTALEQSANLSANQPYHLWFTVKRFTRGTVTPWVGGVAGSPITPTTGSPNAVCCSEESMYPGTFSQGFSMNGAPNGKIQFVPSADFDGAIEDVSVQHIVPGNTVDRLIESYSFTSGQSGTNIFESSLLGKCLFRGQQASPSCPL